MEKTLGKRIAAGRKKLKLTQDQLAEQLGVTAQAVSKWENNQSCPDISMLPKLAELFGTTTDALLGMEPVHEAQVVESENESFRIGNGNVEVHYNGGRKGALGFALWVLATGGLLLSSALLSWELGFWEILWTTGFIVFGLFSLYPKFSFLGLGRTVRRLFPGRQFLPPVL